MYNDIDCCRMPPLKYPLPLDAPHNPALLLPPQSSGMPLYQTYLDLTASEIKLKEAGAKWYNISDEIKGETITLTTSDQMAVYVYDQYDECVYSSYMENRNGKVILPEGGKMVVVGESGSKLTLEQ